MGRDGRWVKWFGEIGMGDLPQVGGKNASLGEMTRHLVKEGVRVPGGFAVTAAAYRQLLLENKLEGPLQRLTGEAAAGRAARRLLLSAKIPAPVEAAVRRAYRELCRREGDPRLAVAVRSSATAEDLPDASFAGQQETFLNVRGEEALARACRRCYASLYTDRAISYRRDKGFADKRVDLSIGVQRMVRSDLGASGVMFSIDTESGFPRVVLINAAFGLGETVVQGEVDPDEYMVFKPLLGRKGLVPILEKKKGAKDLKLVYRPGGQGTRLARTTPRERASFVLTDAEILQLARWAVQVERHYGK
ncbi:MAG TPA: PEP/pyruvate-binding domain-containing protein, partial [bacterium]|nr:PEP/pyruvate-binding domain-containing protein [bacterium]